MGNTRPPERSRGQPVDGFHVLVKFRWLENDILEEQLDVNRNLLYCGKSIGIAPPYWSDPQ